jgi:glutamine amidotransferase
MQEMKQCIDAEYLPLEEVGVCVQKAFKKIYDWQHKHDVDAYSRINILLTDGRRMIATRYVSHPDVLPLSLHYALGRRVNTTDSGELLVPVCENEKPEIILLASEALNDTIGEWKEVPVNHMLLIDEYMNLSLRQIR